MTLEATETPEAGRPAGALPEPVDISRPDLLSDPFTGYSALRETGPVVPAVAPDGQRVWLATRYEEARTVYADPRFVLDPKNVPAPGCPADATASRDLSRGMSSTDGAYHRRLRGPLVQPFSPQQIGRLRPRIDELSAEMADALPAHAEDGVTDLVRHYTRPLPLRLILGLLGVPPGDAEEWEAELVGVDGTDEEWHAAVFGLMGRAHQLVMRRRAEPAEGLITRLLGEEADDGEPRTDVEATTVVLHLLSAGHVTVTHNAIAALLAHPDQLALLRDDPGLLPGAVEELLRWCGPAVRGTARHATEDVELGGTVIRRGDTVYPMICSANRDPRAFDDPDRLDITRRPARRHLALGHGVHRCLGAGLAEHQTAAALDALLRRYPEISLAVPFGELPRVTALDTWDLTALPVRLGPPA